MTGYCTYITEHQSNTYPIGPVTGLPDAIAQTYQHEPADVTSTFVELYRDECIAVYSRPRHPHYSLPAGHVIITVKE